MVMESPCSSVGVVDQVPNTPSVQTPCLPSVSIGDGSSILQIYDLIVVLRNKHNSKSKFRAADLGAFSHEYVKYLPS